MHHDQIMEFYTPLNNYLSNCVIKLHIKLQIQFQSFQDYNMQILQLQKRFICEVFWEFFHSMAKVWQCIFRKAYSHIMVEIGFFFFFFPLFFKCTKLFMDFIYNIGMKTNHVHKPRECHYCGVTACYYKVKHCVTQVLVGVSLCSLLIQQQKTWWIDLFSWGCLSSWLLPVVPCPGTKFKLFIACIICTSR